MVVVLLIYCVQENRLRASWSSHGLYEFYEVVFLSIVPEYFLWFMSWFWSVVNENFDSLIYIGNFLLGLLHLLREISDRSWCLHTLIAIAVA